MKKLITIILILAMLLPAAAGADADPIIGCWYYAFNQENFEPEDRIPGISIEVSLLHFNGEGVIREGVLGFGNGTGLSDYRSPMIVGTWCGLGESNYSVVYESKTRKAYIEDDILYVEYDANNYFPFRRIVEMSKDDLR